MTEPCNNVDPVEIAPGVFWVGRREEGSIFHANPYLRVFYPKSSTGDSSIDSASRPFSMLIDPGSSNDLAIVQAKVSRLIGSLEKLSAVFINHQDPDVGSSIKILAGRYSPHAHIVCSQESWRLIRHYNLPSSRFVATDKYPQGFTVSTGDVLVPVPSPFCHFAGAVMLYDPKTRVLFSGDLFGGLTEVDADGIWAEEGDWTGMRAFHQLYMPSNQALAYTVRAIRNLDPPVEIIAPQHGRVIRGALVEEFLNRIEKLPVGLDIIEDRMATPETLGAWNNVLKRVLTISRDLLGPMADVRLAEAQELSDVLDFDGSQVRIKSLGKWTLEQAVQILTCNEPNSIASAIKYEALLAAEDLALPTPRIDIPEEGEGELLDGPGAGAISGSQLSFPRRNGTED